MAKRHQQRAATAIRGHNNPEKTTVITTGEPKTRKRYKEQVALHQNTESVAQMKKIGIIRDWRENISHKADLQRRMMDRITRSGSDSNAHRQRKRVHEDRKSERQPERAPIAEEYPEVGVRRTDRSLRLNADDMKELHRVLADLGDDELKAISVLPTGTALEQGAKYIDLRHLEQGEVTAFDGMKAKPENLFVAKKDTDYLLWNRLNQVENTERLDEMI